MAQGSGGHDQSLWRQIGGPESGRRSSTTECAALVQKALTLLAAFELARPTAGRPADAPSMHAGSRGHDAVDSPGFHPSLPAEQKFWQELLELLGHL